VFQSCNLIWSSMKKSNLICTMQFSLFFLVASRSEHLCSPLRPIFFVGGVWVFPVFVFFAAEPPVLGSRRGVSPVRSGRTGSFSAPKIFLLFIFQPAVHFPLVKPRRAAKSVDSRHLSFLWHPFFFTGLRLSSSRFLAAVRPLFLLVFLLALTSSSVFLSS
jgi:hypothetical protein